MQFSSIWIVNKLLKKSEQLSVSPKFLSQFFPSKTHIEKMILTSCDSMLFMSEKDRRKRTATRSMPHYCFAAAKNGEK